MTLRGRFERLRGAFWPVSLGLMTVVAGAGVVVGLKAGVMVLASAAAGYGAVLAWRPLAGRLLHSHYRALERAEDEGDDAGVRRLLDELIEFLDERGLTDAAMHCRAHLKSHDEDWPAARALLEAGATRPRSDAERVSFDNALAWCLLHDGETAQAVEMATGAVARAPMIAETRRSYLHGTLGAALLRDGRPAQALAALERAIGLGGARWAQACRQFFRGEALLALERRDEARAAWQAAIDAAPRTRWAARAKERLEAKPSAYR